MRQMWRPVVERITPYDAGKPLETLERELGLDELIRLSANENPLGPSPPWWRRSAGRRPSSTSTPMVGPPPCGPRSAAGWACAPTQIVIGNGADELIGMVALAAFDPGDEVVVPHAVLRALRHVVTLAGARRATRARWPATRPTWTTCWRRSRRGPRP